VEEDDMMVCPVKKRPAITHNPQGTEQIMGFVPDLSTAGFASDRRLAEIYCRIQSSTHKSAGM
jgi:hypothetical protein